MLSKNTTLIELIFVEIYRFKGENRHFTPVFYTEPHRKAPDTVDGGIDPVFTLGPILYTCCKRFDWKKIEKCLLPSFCCYSRLPYERHESPRNNGRVLLPIGSVFGMATLVVSRRAVRNHQRKKTHIKVRQEIAKATCQTPH